MEFEQDDPIPYFNPRDEIVTSHNRLPHWEQAGATYFLTWRLADSIPQDLFQQLSEEKDCWLKTHPEPHSDDETMEYHKIFSTKLDCWMDEGHGACHLRDPGIAKIVSSAFLHFNHVRYAMHSFTVMPNHVHLLFSIAKEEALSDVVHSWKSFTATKINRLLRIEGGKLWQKDYFDRLIRNRQHFSNCVRYIRNNPEKAKLKSADFILYESENASQIK